MFQGFLPRVQRGPGDSAICLRRMGTARARLRFADLGHERGHGNELALLHHIAFREKRMPMGEGEGPARVRAI